MAKSESTGIRKRAMLEALEKSLGVVTSACASVGITRVTHYQWINNDPEYREAVHDITEMAIDFVESKLYKQISNENTTATIFYLKTKAKHRGYVERTEIQHGGNLDLSSKLSDEAKNKIEQILENEY
jgi:hypothetical protein